MKYLCLVYMDEKQPDDRSRQRLHGLRRSARGRAVTRIAAEALQSVHTATTVRVRNGKMSVTDGPFAETKEQLAGFYLIDATDLNEADPACLEDPAGARRQHRGASDAGALGHR